MDRATVGKSVEQFPQTKDPTYNNAFNDKQKALLGAESDSSENSQQKPTSISQGEKTANTEGAGTPPDATGKTLVEATQLLKDWKAAYVTEYSSTVAKDTVIRQYVSSDGTVIIVLSTGPKTSA